VGFGDKCLRKQQFPLLYWDYSNHLRENADKFSTQKPQDILQLFLIQFNLVVCSENRKLRKLII
jgi:hypothetical protein